jgi:hypothetical protein
MQARLPWLWLDEAAIIIAERRASEQLQKNTARASALRSAREELLDWAYRGALEVHGKYWTIDGPEKRDFPDDENWVGIKASMWDPQRRPKETERAELPALPATMDPDATEPLSSEAAILALLTSPAPESSSGSEPSGTYVVVNWEQNVLTIDGPEMFEPHGYHDLRVRAADIDQILPPANTEIGKVGASGKRGGSAGSPSLRNPGGAPRKFVDDFLIEIIRIANGLDGLPDNKQDLVRQLREYHASSWGDDFPSDSTIQQIVNRVYKHVRPQKP